MGMSRRGFLLSTGVVLTAGCATEVTGTPAADPRATRTREKPETREPDEPDSVTVGIFVYPPYAVEDGGDLTGPVPDVARAVLEQLGITDVEFTQLHEPEQLIAMLQVDRIALGGGLGINPDRCDAMRFSDPDHISGTAFAVPAGNPKGLKVFADVVAKNARVGVVEGAPEDDDATAAGVPVANLVRMPDPIVLLRALGQGEFDCFAFDDITLRDLVQREGEGLEVAAPFLPENRPPFVGAYAFPKDSDLLDSFNDELHKLHESGEWLRMVEPFGFTEDNAPPSDITIEELCGGR